MNDFLPATAAAALLGAGLLVLTLPVPGAAEAVALPAAWVGAAGLGWALWRSRLGRRRLAGAKADLEERARALRESRDELESAYAELRFEEADLVNSARLATIGSLVAGIAHELDTPLGALNSNHDVLRRALERLQGILADERVDPSELKEVRRIVRAVDGVLDTNELAVERLVGLVGSLRSFARPDRSSRDRVDLHEGIEDTLTLLRHRMAAGIEVRREYGELPRVECFPDQLNQVFMNLLLNASQAIEGTGTIEIRTSPGDGEVAVEFRDTGSGIPEDHLERIFDPGFTTKGSRMGMGLGLLITRQVVERHGGDISVESEVGEGTRFTLTLPVDLPPGAEEERAPRGGREHPNSGEVTDA